MSSVTLNPLFSSHMVLQANKPIRFFGEGDGDVTVSIQGNTAKATCDGGKWLAELPAMPFGGPYTATICADGDSVVIDDIYVGEVFIIAGQSNLQFKMNSGDKHLDECCDIPRMRLFSSPRLEAGEPFSPADGWVVCTKENAVNWSAIGFLTGKILEQEKDVAVGVITSYQGASVIETWVPEGLFEANGILLSDEDKSYGHHCSEYSAWNKNGTLYHYVVEKLMPYSVGSVVWYQGESDTTLAEAEIYDKELSLLISCWREGYRDASLPFIVVQLADLLEAATGQVSNGWRRLQQAQWDVQSQIENVVTVKCADISENDDIHPQTKAPLARRIATVMLEK